MAEVGPPSNDLVLVRGGETTETSRGKKAMRTEAETGRQLHAEEPRDCWKLLEAGKD